MLSFKLFSNGEEGKTSSIFDTPVDLEISAKTSEKLYLLVDPELRHLFIIWHWERQGFPIYAMDYGH
mgnify:FL=1